MPSLKKKPKIPKELKQTAAAIVPVSNQDEVQVTLTVKSPPRMVKSVKDLIFWEYAKLIAESAGYKDNYGFIVSKFKKLKSGELKWKEVDQDAIDYQFKERKCIYCGEKENLTKDHIIPKIKGGKDIPANIVLACKKCNCSKNDSDVFEWYYVKKKVKNIPSHIWKRYLKLVWEFHTINRTLDRVDVNMDGKLDLMDLSAVFDR